MGDSMVERIPLPNLRVYTAGSVLVLAAAAAVALREAAASNATDLVADAFLYLIDDPISIWAMINMAYCGVALVGWGVQTAVFGRLREAEVARLKDRLWNYVFYKFIFVFGVINATFMDEVLLWAGWFTLLGSLYLLTQLCNDRLDYTGASSERGRAGRLAATLGGAAAGALAAGGGAVWLLLPTSPALAAFCLTECVLVVSCALQVGSRLLLAGRDADDALHYYTMLLFDVVVTVTEAADTLHMLCACRLAPSLAALLLLLRLRALTARLAARAAAHRARAAAAAHVHRRYPLASNKEMCRNEDKCAICWQPMTEARKLPCEHLFHSGCLCRWVQQHASCPTCRRALPAPRAPRVPGAPGAPRAPTPPALHIHQASRVVWWLPSLTADLPTPQMQGLFPDAQVETLLLGEDREVAPPAPPPPAGARAPPPRSDAHTSTNVEAATSTTFIRDLERHPFSVINNMSTTSPVFPKDASERERTLQLRKQALVEEARRKYLEKMTKARNS